MLSKENHFAFSIYTLNYIYISINLLTFLNKTFASPSILNLNTNSPLTKKLNSLLLEIYRLYFFKFTTQSSPQQTPEQTPSFYPKYALLFHELLKYSVYCLNI